MISFFKYHKYHRLDIIDKQLWRKLGTKPMWLVMCVSLVSFWFIEAGKLD